MREYSSFHASFWTGETGKKLHGDADAQVLAAYLFTNRHANLLGLYFLPLAYASHETGLSAERISAAFNKLSSAEVLFALYDEKTEHVWVIAMASRQISTSEKARAGAMKLLKSCRKGVLYDEFCNRYGATLERLDKPRERLLRDTLSNAADRVSLVALRQDKTPDKTPDKTDTADPTRSAPAAGAAPDLAMTDHEALDADSSEPDDGPVAKQPDPVFAHWVKVMGKDPVRTRLTPDRKRKLKARRAEGFTDEQLCQSIDGCRLSAWHMGSNEQGEVYNDLETIMRKGSTVEKHIERATGSRPRGSPTKPRLVSAPGTTAKDFEDVDDVETQVARWSK